MLAKENIKNQNATSVVKIHKTFIDQRDAWNLYPKLLTQQSF